MRKKKQISRRRRAFRWLVLLAALAAWAVLPGRFRFLPGQAIREAERLGNLGPTRLIAELSGHEGRTLRGNGKGLMIFLLTESVERGWDAQDRTYLDCSKPAPFHVGFSTYGFWQNGDLVGMADWFGRIDDPAADAVRLELYERGELWNTFTVEKEDWIEQDGFTYFVLEFEKHGWAPDTILRSQLLDEAGNLLAVRETEWDVSGRGLYDMQYQ
ncbi:MAG: hypothetical protein J6J87_03200 [Oscillospiraceae bacterium]|nr:hypothetical protein [Oscillospiraceae bacterium]